MSLKDYHDLLIELRNENISYKEIAEQLSYKRDTIKHYCQKNNIRGMIDNSLETREQEYIKRFNEMFPDFEYISGYETYDSKIKVKCKICGHIQERHANNKDYMKCDNCVELDRLERVKVKEIEIEQKEKQKLIINLIKIINNQTDRIEREKQLHKVCQRCGSKYTAKATNNVHCDKCLGEFKVEQANKAESLIGRICKECGNKFDATNIRGHYCSDECKRKAINRMKEVDRRYKLKENGKVDYNISLKKLYKRDKSICHICGEQCNPKDYIKNNNVFIAGNSYPSIDHVIPVAKGGTHTWDNVKLAHRHCNSVKKDNIIYQEDNRQFRIF